MTICPRPRPRPLRPEPARPDQGRPLLRLAATIAVIGCALATTACNTVEGMGKDTQKAGQAIEHSAE